jgi:hypothetical protein
MTAVTTTRDRVDGGGVSLPAVLHAEWIKLRTLRSTWFSLLATMIVVIGLGTLFSAIEAHHLHRFETLDPAEVSLRGVFLAQLTVTVLGVLVITGEYTTGMIHSSLEAVPRRYPVLAGKAAVFAVVTFAISLASTFVAFVLGQQALASSHQQASLGTPHVLRAIVGAAIYLTLVGLLAVGVGFILRNTGGAIATVVGIVLILPLLTQALPDPYSYDVGKFLPLNTGAQIVTIRHSDPHMFGPWAGLGITAIWAAVALAAGTVTLLRRDA